MIGHLSARQIGGRPPIDLDLDAVFSAAVETGTALEINGSLPRLDLSLDALRRGRNYPLTLVVTSDAHEVEELKRIDFAVLQAERAWVPPESIINIGPPERLIAWAERPKGEITGRR
jgi:DNA polymerase (family 10)